jgi:hypothetical protein
MDLVGDQERTSTMPSRPLITVSREATKGAVLVEVVRHLRKWSENLLIVFWPAKEDAFRRAAIDRRETQCSPRVNRTDQS